MANVFAGELQNYCHGIRQARNYDKGLKADCFSLFQGSAYKVGCKAAEAAYKYGKEKTKEKVCLTVSHNKDYLNTCYGVHTAIKNSGDDMDRVCGQLPKEQKNGCYGAMAVEHYYRSNEYGTEDEVCDFLQKYENRK